MKNSMIRLCLILIIFMLTGCISGPQFDALWNLKQLGDNQQTIAAYIKRQDSLFKQLLLDASNNRIKAGLTKDYIVRQYGDPVFVKSGHDFLDFSGDVWYYRYATRYFGSDWVLLIFDEQELLSAYAVKPASDVGKLF